MGIEIRLATDKDKESIMDSFDHYENPELLKNRVNFFIDNGRTLLACENEKMLGRIQFYMKENPAEGLFEIEEFYVLDEHRNQGIGKMLVENALEYMRGFCKKNNINFKTAFAFMNKENMAARRVFEAFGFKEMSEIPNLFGEETTIIMIYKEEN